jgi:hypothetical protein
MKPPGNLVMTHTMQMPGQPPLQRHCPPARRAIVGYTYLKTLDIFRLPVSAQLTNVAGDRVAPGARDRSDSAALSTSERIAAASATPVVLEIPWLPL